MKILYHHRTLGDGAEGIHIAEMVNAFRELGHEVMVTGPAKEKNLEASIRETGVKKLKGLVKGPAYEFLEFGYNFYNFISLSKVVKYYQPDFIYDRYITYNYSCVAFGRTNNIPVFLEVNAPLAYERDNEADEVLYLRKLAYFIEKKTCKDAFKTIVVSTPLKEYLMSLGVPDSKIIVLPNGVNPEKFKPKPPLRALKKSLNISNQDTIIGFVGILRPWHGIDLLLKAFGRVYSIFPKTKLLLVGGGPIQSQIEKQARERGFEDQVIITGRVPHEKVSDYIALFDIAVSPKATFYASPMKIPEYMIQKKAVVAPDTENIKDLVMDNVTGRLFKNGSTESLSDKLISFLGNASERRTIGDQAYGDIFLRRTWIKNADRIINFMKA